jgi:hypothetical protein
LSESQANEPELITIVEGPTPNFHIDAAPWSLSVLEGRAGYVVAHCQVRSLKGEVLMERCQRAWREQRGIRLDFKQLDGLRRQVSIVAAKLDKVEGTDVLHLWVRQKLNLLIARIGDDSSDDDLMIE